MRGFIWDLSDPVLFVLAATLTAAMLIMAEILRLLAIEITRQILKRAREHQTDRSGIDWVAARNWAMKWSLGFYRGAPLLLTVLAFFQWITIDQLKDTAVAHGVPAASLEVSNEDRTAAAASPPGTMTVQRSNEGEVLINYVLRSQSIPVNWVSK